MSTHCPDPTHRNQIGYNKGPYGSRRSQNIPLFLSQTYFQFERLSPILETVNTWLGYTPTL